MKKSEVDSGKCAGLPSDAAEKMKALERENREIRRVFNENFQVYGVRKTRRQLQREGYGIARCTAYEGNGATEHHP